DRYADPGDPVTRPGSDVIIQTGDDIFLESTGPTPEGDRPFLDRFNLTTLTSTRIWQSDPNAYETIVALIDDAGAKLITSRETPGTPANYMARDVAAKQARALTTFKDPHPQLSDVQKKLVTYTRKDGVQ